MNIGSDSHTDFPVTHANIIENLLQKMQLYFFASMLNLLSELQIHQTETKGSTMTEEVNSLLECSTRESNNIAVKTITRDGPRSN